MDNRQSYETLYIVDLALGEEGIAAMIEKFKTLIEQNGEIVETNEWGKRKLAYPINDKPEGYYVLVKFNAVAGFTSELERVFNITEGIMRSIVVKTEA